MAVDHEAQRNEYRWWKVWIKWNQNMLDCVNIKSQKEIKLNFKVFYG